MQHSFKNTASNRTSRGSHARFLTLGAVGALTLASLGQAQSANLETLVLRGRNYQELRHLNYLSAWADVRMEDSTCQDMLQLVGRGDAGGSRGGAGGPAPAGTGGGAGSPGFTGRLAGLGGTHKDARRHCAVPRYGGGEVISGDFDGDGRLETAWREKGGTVWRFTDGTRIDDGISTYNPLQATTVVGDFDGDGKEEIAWRRDKSNFWVVTDENGTQTIVDGIDDVDFSQPDVSVAVGDFDCDGVDDIAWRKRGYDGWVVNSLPTPMSLATDGHTGFDPENHPVHLGDFDGDGCDDIAWRTEMSGSWTVNGLATSPWSLSDGASEGFFPSDLLSVAGDFDGDGSDDLAWRLNGDSAWFVNSLAGNFSIIDGDVGFDSTAHQTLVGDFDGDDADDIAWRPDGSTSWNVNSFGNPLWSIVDQHASFLNARPTHVGDFDGDGADDLAWLAQELTSWHIDAAHGSWQESTMDPGISLELAFTDVDEDGDSDDYILVVRGPEGDGFMLYKPLTMAYLLKTQGMTITEEFFRALSPEQQESLYLDSQTAELSSGFTKTDPDGPNEYPNVQFDQGEFNLNVDSISSMSGEASYSALSIDIADFEESQYGIDLGGSVNVINFDAGFSSNGQYGGDLNFSVVEAEYTFGDITYEVTVGEVAAEAYISDGGFSFNAGVTLVGVTKTVGDQDGTHASAGIGFGIGAAAGGSWGENDQYGANVDIKFVSVAVYVKGEDVENVFNESKDWIVDAYDDTGEWTQDAWDSTIGALSDLGDSATIMIFGPDGKAVLLEARDLAAQGIEYLVAGDTQGLVLLAQAGNQTFNGFMGGLTTSGSNLGNTIVDEAEDFATDDSNPIGFVGNATGLW